MSAIILASTENMPYQEWLELRKRGIGGSDASVVCGLNRYKAPVELWMEKTDQLPYQEAGEAAYWGTQLEALVRDEFTKRTGIEVIHTHQLLQSEEQPFMLANLDGVCEHPELGTCVFEAKTASAFKASEWENGIPDEYQLQVQHYLSVTGYAGAYIAVLIGGNTFRWKFIERDEELISMLIQLEENFWGCVQDLVPPVLDGSNASAINGVVTRITLEKSTSKGGKPFALFNFEAVSTLSPEETAMAKAFGQQFMENVNLNEVASDLPEVS